MSSLRSVLTFLLTGMFLLTSSLHAQTSDELIDKLLDLSKQSQKLDPDKADDQVRRLLIQRYNVAIDELRLRCEDFKRQVSTKAMVFEAGKHLLQAELELHSQPEEKIKVLERTVELITWYEKRIERAVENGLAPRADLLRIQYNRLTLEIDLLKLKQSSRDQGTK